MFNNPNRNHEIQSDLVDLLILLWFAANSDLMMNPIESDHESWILLLIWCWILNPNPNPEANPNLHCSSQCKHCSEQCNLFLVVFFSLEILFWFLLKTFITEIQQTETIFEKSCATEDVFRKYYQSVVFCEITEIIEKVYPLVLFPCEIRSGWKKM